MESTVQFRPNCTYDLWLSRPQIITHQSTCNHEFSESLGANPPELGHVVEDIVTGFEAIVIAIGEGTKGQTLSSEFQLSQQDHHFHFVATSAMANCNATTISFILTSFELVLHESAGSFSLVVESLELAGSDAVLAMAWKGKDVHEWHKHIAYGVRTRHEKIKQESLTFMALHVAIYALLKMAIDVAVLVSHERHNNSSPVKTILTHKLNAVAEYIESQLSIRNPELIQWFRDVELPHCLATQGLFTYLGRMNRIFLTNKGIKDFDELVKNFLSYLECGSLFIYPEFSSISVYQLFMQLDYLTFMLHFLPWAIMREKGPNNMLFKRREIILSNVFGVCYDVFSGFAYFCRSTQQPLDSNLLSFLLWR
ncbi:hypothetical protein Ddye_024009 [Dipteronia dyeriana]|uniref:Uncharacterized protein n=1 Tax=Dipteronia dyeriana TaxID=168575 RepID=A0AAD9TUN2_9ROSI|nr:hypothetical protein Ddye_024009 [Dipteronia dyeriana]